MLYLYNPQTLSTVTLYVIPVLKFKEGKLENPPGGGHIIFAFSGVRRPSGLVSGHFKEKYLSYLYQIWYGCLLR